MQSPYTAYWGKADSQNPTAHHLLACHCLDVAAVGRVLLDQDSFLADRLGALLGVKHEVLRNIVPLLLALHDVGKFSIRFQNLRPNLLLALQDQTSSRHFELRHGPLGRLLLEDVLVRRLAALEDVQLKPLRLLDCIGPLLQAVTGHHGAPPALDSNKHRLALEFEPQDLEAAGFFLDGLLDLFPPQAFLAHVAEQEQSYGKTSKRASWLLAGVCMLCDWIGSDQRRFPFVARIESLEQYWEETALPQAGQAVEASGVIVPSPSNRSSFHDLCPHVPVDANPTDLQRYALDQPLGRGPQLFIFEDLTGSGKTEAALLMAHRLLRQGLGRSIYFALPTMATANAMYERLATAYARLFDSAGNPSLVLVHGARHLSEAFLDSTRLDDLGEMPGGPDYHKEEGEEEGAARCAAWLANNKKKAFLAACGVGSVDQALLAVLPVKHQALRLAGLARAVLVVDEVHAYEPYTHKLLCGLLEFHAAQGGSAILLSATLPLATRMDLAAAFRKGLGAQPPELEQDAYPLATRIDADACGSVPLVPRPASCRDLPVSLVEDEAAAVEAIVAATRQGACACWVRNTVNDARQAFDLLSEQLPLERLTLFHACFAMGDRLGIEKAVLDSFGKKSTSEVREGRVVVATQVVEQSLDVDFDLLVSDLAPMELLIQRAGRCGRHAERQRPDGFGAPRMIVVSPDPSEDADGSWYGAFFPKGQYVYPSHGQLWLTARLLNERGVLALPSQARELVEAVYGEAAEAIPAPLAERDARAEGEEWAEAAMAVSNLLHMAGGYVSGSQWLDDTVVPTRLGSPRTQVRLARVEDGVIVPWIDAEKPSQAWSLSEVSVSSRDVAAAADSPDSLRAACKAAQQTMPDKGKWSVLVVLENEPGRPCWTGWARDRDGVLRCLRYGRQSGLMFDDD